VSVAPSNHRTALPGPVPATAGIGLRTPHHAEILRDRPAIGWFEVHSENYFADGGMQIEHLLNTRSSYPLSLHGVGLSIGSTDPLDREHLRRLKRLVERCQPALVSEHLSWGSVAGTHLNDLLPMPMTEEALLHMIARVGEVQDYLGRRILIENPSTYLRFSDGELTEWEFLTTLASHADCGLLVDVNNVYVSARNHGFDAADYLAALPRERVGELHLAGHTVKHFGEREILIDTHSAPVCDAVWALYEHALECFGPVPTLIEWDAEIPALEVLLSEAAQANRRLERLHALVA
jgi:uncharacterized protein (UPF0276 family)